MLNTYKFKLLDYTCRETYVLIYDWCFKISEIKSNLVNKKTEILNLTMNMQISYLPGAMV